jgi:hypothetical protein
MSIFSTGISRDERSGGAMKPLAPTKIWQLIKEGRLEVVRVDRRTLVKFASLERLLDAATHAPRRRGRPRKLDQGAGECPPRRPGPGASRTGAGNHRVIHRRPLFPLY